MKVLMKSFEAQALESVKALKSNEYAIYLAAKGAWLDGYKQCKENLLKELVDAPPLVLETIKNLDTELVEVVLDTNQVFYTQDKEQKERFHKAMERIMEQHKAMFESLAKLEEKEPISQLRNS